jgi:hypothetical protein
VSRIISICDPELSYWRKVKKPRFHQENQDHVLLRSSQLSPQDLYPLRSLFEGVAQNCLEEKISHVYPSQNSIF